ncbi:MULTISPECIES: hypothetical protein [unclassified Rickettsia]|uniref:hypothetical protein n=1 Tax=unclassified Rickettsia TaxID=114295 RepID=UPI003132C902
MTNENDYNKLIVHKIDFTVNDDFETVEYNEELIGEYYQDELEPTNDYNDWADQINEMFWSEIGCQGTYYEPKTFNEAIALECTLMPFKYQGKNMLALQNREKGHYTARLRAYKLLTDVIITNNIYYFTSEGKFHDYAETFIEKDMLDMIQRAYTRALKYNHLVSGDKIQDYQLPKTSS